MPYGKKNREMADMQTPINKEQSIDVSPWNSLPSSWLFLVSESPMGAQSFFKIFILSGCKKLSLSVQRNYHFVFGFIFSTSPANKIISFQGKESLYGEVRSVWAKERDLTGSKRLGMRIYYCKDICFAQHISNQTSKVWCSFPPTALVLFHNWRALWFSLLAKVYKFSSMDGVTPQKKVFSPLIVKTFVITSCVYS